MSRTDVNSGNGLHHAHAETPKKESDKFDMTQGSIHSQDMGTAARANGNKARFDLMPVGQLAYLVKHEKMIMDIAPQTGAKELLEVLGQFQRNECDAMVLLTASVCYMIHYYPAPSVLTALEDVCHVWLYGLHKYAEWNWAKGAPWWVPIGCIVRHIDKTEKDWEEMDDDSGFSHLAHIVCNAMMLAHYEEFWNARSKEADCRPYQYFQKPETPGLLIADEMLGG